MFEKKSGRHRSTKVLPSRHGGGWRAGSIPEPDRQPHEKPQRGIPICRICGHRNNGCKPPWFKRGSLLWTRWHDYGWYYPRVHHIENSKGEKEICIGSLLVAERNFDYDYYGKKPE